MPSAQLTSVSTHFGAGTWGLGSGAAARCWVLRDRVFGSSPSGLALVFLPVGGLRGGYRPYFENYTVDASIFKDSERQVFQKGSVGSCDFKSLRAVGGCLGIWSRRRT